MEAFSTAIATVGFPIALTIWLLVRFDKRIQELVESINGRDGIISKQDAIIKMQTETISYLRKHQGVK
jgi:hypothetical protein